MRPFLRGFCPNVISGAKDDKPVYAIDAARRHNRRTAVFRCRQLRALAVTGARRTPIAPELPTVAEAALPGYAVEAWFGLLAPAGMPAPLAERISNEVRSALNDPDSVAKLDPLGIVNVGSTPERFAAYLREEIDFVGGIVNRLGIKPEQ